jgi:hypothetical protein
MWGWRVTRSTGTRASSGQKTGARRCLPREELSRPYLNVYRKRPLASPVERVSITGMVQARVEALQAARVLFLSLCRV